MPGTSRANLGSTIGFQTSRQFILVPAIFSGVTVTNAASGNWAGGAALSPQAARREAIAKKWHQHFLSKRKELMSFFEEKVTGFPE